MMKRNIPMAGDCGKKKPKAYTLKEHVPEEPIYVTQAKKDTHAMAQFFHSRFPNSIMVELEEMQGNIKEKRKNLYNE
jgi:hypothetical protein